METSDDNKVRIVIYDPPVEGLPYLSVAFIPGEEIPQAIPFDTAAEAAAFNKHAAAIVMGRDKERSRQALLPEAQANSPDNRKAPHL
jgi:hypothetical protein